MLKIRYDAANGQAIADGKSAEFVDQIIKQWNDSGAEADLEICVANTVVIDQFRVRVVREDIDHTNLVFLFGDKQMAVSRAGRLNNWPRGFCDIPEDLIMELLDFNCKGDQ